MTPRRVMKETTRQEAPSPFVPLGYFCVQHGSVPMELDCAHGWKLERESAKWRQINATPSRLPPLTGAFARGWNTLPAELKLRIFSFVTGSALAASPCCHKRLLRWHDMETISRRIIQFARCTPEFKILAEQTIYSEHQFAIDTWLGVSMPPSKYVRLLTIELDLYDRVHQARRILESLRDNRSAFQIKRLIVVIINYDRLPIDSDAKELLSQRFELCARSGWVRVINPLASILLFAHQSLEQYEEIKKLAEKNITFSPALLDAKRLIQEDEDVGEGKINKEDSFSQTSPQVCR